MWPWLCCKEASAHRSSSVLVTLFQGPHCLALLAMRLAHEPFMLPAASDKRRPERNWLWISLECECWFTVMLGPLTYDSKSLRMKTQIVEWPRQAMQTPEICCSAGTCAQTKLRLTVGEAWVTGKSLGLSGSLRQAGCLCCAHACPKPPVVPVCVYTVDMGLTRKLWKLSLWDQSMSLTRYNLHRLFSFLTLLD